MKKGEYYKYSHTFYKVAYFLAQDNTLNKYNFEKHDTLESAKNTKREIKVVSSIGSQHPINDCEKINFDPFDFWEHLHEEYNTIKEIFHTFKERRISKKNGYHYILEDENLYIIYDEYDEGFKLMLDKKSRGKWKLSDIDTKDKKNIKFCLSQCSLYYISNNR